MQSINLKKNENCFEHVLDHPINALIKKITSLGGQLAGGFALGIARTAIANSSFSVNYVLDYTDSDIDFFFTDKQSCTNVKSLLESRFKKIVPDKITKVLSLYESSFEVTTFKAVTGNIEHKIQLIFKNDQNYLLSFDIENCKVRYDGEKLFFVDIDHWYELESSGLLGVSAFVPQKELFAGDRKFADPLDAAKAATTVKLVKRLQKHSKKYRFGLPAITGLQFANENDKKIFDMMVADQPWMFYSVKHLISNDDLAMLASITRTENAFNDIINEIKTRRESVEVDKCKFVEL